MESCDDDELTLAQDAFDVRESTDAEPHKDLQGIHISEAAAD